MKRRKRHAPPPYHYNPLPMFGLRVRRVKWSGVLESIRILDMAKAEDLLFRPALRLLRDAIGKETYGL